MSSQETLGRRLRAQRLAQHLTLEALSRMAGVSKAMLSQIEQDKVNPTVATILKITQALGLGLNDLVESGGQSRILRLIPAEDPKYTFRTDKACLIRTLSPLSLEKSIEFYRVCLGAGGELASEAHFAGTQEFLHVARGRLTVTCDQETVKLGRGDSLHYRADVPHVLANPGRSEAEVYLIVRYRTD